MQPKHHPIEKENPLPNLHFLGSMLIFQGVSLYFKHTPVNLTALWILLKLWTQTLALQGVPRIHPTELDGFPTFSAVQKGVFRLSGSRTPFEVTSDSSSFGKGTQNQSNVANGQRGGGAWFFWIHGRKNVGSCMCISVYGSV